MNNSIFTRSALKELRHKLDLEETRFYQAIKDLYDQDTFSLLEIALMKKHGVITPIGAELIIHAAGLDKKKIAKSFGIELTISVKPLEI